MSVQNRPTSRYYAKGKRVGESQTCDQNDLIFRKNLRYVGHVLLV